MKFRSIRSRLALSFAGIALIAAIALGAVLLAILQNYYSGLEFDYLRENARVIGRFFAAMVYNNASQDEVESQLRNLAFLTQTRIEIFDPTGLPLFDSGSPQSVDVNLGVMKQFALQTNGGPPPDELRVIAVGPKEDAVFVDGETAPVGPSRRVFVYGSVQAAGSPFGFDLSAEAMPKPGRRSKLAVMEPLWDPITGSLLGSVRLSEGPAYGTAVLESVAGGWLLASAIAVLLAAVIGWYISRRISAPVLALTDVTARMSHGDLSSRAEVRSRDELGQLARSFNDMAGQVETTVTTLRTFVSDAAHEINTPLTALKTNLELAINERDLAQRDEFLNRAIEQNRRLEHLANELLDLSRIEAARPAPDFELFDLRDLSAQIAERFASRAEQAARTFDLILPDHEIPMRGDRHQIQRAVENLLENALKFSGPDGVMTLEGKENEREAILTVTDTGIGIMPDDLPHLFGRFHRGHNSAEYPGNGLGLAIAKAIVSAHGGQIEAQSAGEGQGSSFSIRLPKELPG